MRAEQFIAAIAVWLSACGSPSGAEPPASTALMMRVPRAAHAAVSIPDGRVLLIGGCVRESCEAGSESGTVDVFDPRVGRFQRAGVLLGPRVSTIAASLTNDRVFVAGGWVGSTVTDSTEIFDVRSGRSTPAGKMSSPKADMALATLRDGRILIAGGYDGRAALSTIEVFDPRTGLVRRIGELAVARAGAGAALLTDGQVLIVGGGTNGPAGLRALTDAEIIDPTTGTSKLTGGMASARYKHAVIALPDGTVLALGGSDERDSQGKHDTIERFDPSTGRFSPAGRMLHKRYKIANSVVLFPEGQVLIVGGASRAEIYDPASLQTVQTGPELGGSLNFATASLLHGKRVLVAGGYYEDGIRMSRRAWILQQ